jgi:galactokinase
LPLAALAGYHGGMDLDGLCHAFRRTFGGEPTSAVRAPGRVNLLGEHTDYNQGFVLPMAIDLAISIALRPRNDRQVQIHSLELDDRVTIQLENLSPGVGGWASYVNGVAWALQQEGLAVEGWDGVIASQIPIGSGLSSSAALGMALARAFSVVGAWEWDARRMAVLVQRAENEWVGVRCGVMDQMASACGLQGHALLLDCLDLSIDLVRLPTQASVVVLDTSTRHELASSGYNDRRTECEAAAQALGLASLRYASEPDLIAQTPRLDPVLFKRARHVVAENARTLQGAGALQADDCIRFGELMNASHRSLAQDFEVSTPELDRMAALARDHAGCYGARMMGGGFGGSVVCLVDKEAAPSLCEGVVRKFKGQTGLQGSGRVCQAAEGTSRLL